MRVTVKSDRTLDCVGLYCPMPIVNTNAEIKRIKVGEVLEILADARARTGLPCDVAWTFS